MGKLFDAVDITEQSLTRKDSIGRRGRCSSLFLPPLGEEGQFGIVLGHIFFSPDKGTTVLEHQRVQLVTPQASF